MTPTPKRSALTEDENIELFKVLHPSKKRQTKPSPLVTQVPLVDVFERLKRVKADAWQVDFCQRLQDAAEERHLDGKPAVRSVTHCEAQLGKSGIIAQALACYLFGHQPTHRITLATYNQTNSQKHAEAVIYDMNSPEYKDMFPNRDSWLLPNSSKAKFFTHARREINDGQPSYNPVGLQSGFTGMGADTLIMDDPYSSMEEVASDTIREKLERFYAITAEPRTDGNTLVLAMFHRYAYNDLAGYLLANYDFDYWRYASVCDGDFTDKQTGRVFTDPMGRDIGECVLPERKPIFRYERFKKNKMLWLSQFQGRPPQEGSSFFNTDLIKKLNQRESLQKESECIHWVRGWDNAATEGDGAYTVGVKMGITPSGDKLITDVKRKPEFFPRNMLGNKILGSSVNNHKLGKQLMELRTHLPECSDHRQGKRFHS